MSIARSDLIRVAIADIISKVGGREQFYDKLARTYSKGTVTRATVSMWVINGEVPASKATHLSAWSNGKYAPADLCSALAIE